LREKRETAATGREEGSESDSERATTKRAAVTRVQLQQAVGLRRSGRDVGIVVEEREHSSPKLSSDFPNHRSFPAPCVLSGRSQLCTSGSKQRCPIGQDLFQAIQAQTRCLEAATGRMDTPWAFDQQCHGLFDSEVGALLRANQGELNCCSKAGHSFLVNNI